MLSELESFKAGFLTRCVENGIDTDEALSHIKAASDRLDAAEKQAGDGSAKQAGSSVPVATTTKDAGSYSPRQASTFMVVPWRQTGGSGASGRIAWLLTARGTIRYGPIWNWPTSAESKPTICGTAPWFPNTFSSTLSAATPGKNQSSPDA